MGEAVDTIPSILNKCLFVSPDGRRRMPDHGSTISSHGELVAEMS